MKKFLNKIKTKAQTAYIAAKTQIENRKAEGYVDSGVKILIAVVIGTLLLTGLYMLFNTTIFPTLQTKIQGLFNYSGAN